jgi:hypothetical protein
LQIKRLGGGYRKRNSNYWKYKTLMGMSADRKIMNLNNYLPNGNAPVIIINE